MYRANPPASAERMADMVISFFSIASVQGLLLGGLLALCFWLDFQTNSPERFIVGHVLGLSIPKYLHYVDA